MSGQDPVSFSIIIPTFRRPRQLVSCLQALSRLDYPRDRFEVIVVDDGTPVSLEPAVASFQDRFDLTLLVQANAGPAAARNRGAARARGQFLAFTDDDCAPAPGWLRALGSALARWPDHMVGGRTENALPDNPYAAASQLLVSYLYDYYNAGPDGARLFTTNNLALAEEHMRAVGGFDTGYPRPGAEDREFCDRWLAHGHRLTYVPEAVIYHAHRLAWGGYWKLHLRYGRGAYLYHQTRARRGRGPAAVEPLSFYVDLVRYPYAQGLGRRAHWLAALLAMSQVANVLGFFGEQIVQARARRRSG